MRNSGKLKEYLSQFFDYVVRKAVEIHPRVTETILLHSYPVEREVWCVFVYDPEIESFESRCEMWADFWENLCERREVFYSEFKKPGLGYITVYPLFVSRKRLQKLLEVLPQIQRTT